MLDKLAGSGKIMAMDKDYTNCKIRKSSLKMAKSISSLTGETLIAVIERVLSLELMRVSGEFDKTVREAREKYGT